MTSHVPLEILRAVIERAKNTCEYCRMAASDTFYGCQVDHVIAEKHGGQTILENLAMACTFCNRFKGTDIGSIAVSTGEFTRFFNPRTDEWRVHFKFDLFRIVQVTPIGEVTVAILQMNSTERQMEREMLNLAGKGWPPADFDKG